MTTNSTRYRLLGAGFVIVFFLGVAGVAFWQFATSFVEKGIASGSPFDNAAMFPRLVTWCIVLLSLAVAVQFLLGKSGEDAVSDTPQDIAEGGREAAQDTLAATEQEPSRDLLLRALSCSLVFVVYLYVVPITGYIVATVAMLCACALILGTRLFAAILFSFLITLLVGFVFGTVLNVVLPVGTLGLPTIF